MDAQRPPLAGWSFYLVGLVFREADEVDAQVRGKRVEAKCLLGELSCNPLSVFSTHSWPRIDLENNRPPFPCTLYTPGGSSGPLKRPFAGPLAAAALRKYFDFLFDFPAH
jgi:hypothetical protein